MELAFAGAVAFTIGVSFFCSLLEALILSTTVAEIEAFKKLKPKKGAILERLKTGLSETISAILTLNTIANTAGSVMVGGIGAKLFDSFWLGVVMAGLTVSILIFSEVIPKNLGVVYRVKLLPWIVWPLVTMKTLLKPLTYFADFSVRLVVNPNEQEEEGSNEEEIILLAEKGAKEGKLTSSESNMIANALTLDDVIVSEIMTPRVVVKALEHDLTVGAVFEEEPNVPFARIPVFKDEIDNIVGIIRRRDLLTQKAEDKDDLKISEIMGEVQFIPETVTVSSALQKVLKTHQQMLIVADEYGSLAGVVTMEDIVEYILGREIFEKDDVAIDMRELAREENRDTLIERSAENK